MKPASEETRAIRRRQFRLRSLFSLTFVIALYCGAFAADSEDMRHLLVLVATFVFLGVFGIGWNWAAWVGFSFGATVGLAFWWCEDSLKPFNPQDRRFYLVVYTALAGSGGMLAGFVWSLVRRTGAKQPSYLNKRKTPRESGTPTHQDG